MLLISRFTQKEQEKEAQKCVLLDQVHAHFVKLTKETFFVVYVGAYHFQDDYVKRKYRVYFDEEKVMLFSPQKFADIKVLSLFMVKVIIPFNVMSSSSKKWVKYKSPSSF